MTPNHTIRTTLLTAVLCFGLLGCRGGSKVVGDDTLIDNPNPVAADIARTTPVVAIGDAERGFPIDGMVGQINGRPIYADTVFIGADPIEDQLAALGRRLQRPVFRVESRRLIESRLRSMVLDALILAEAERSLSEPQQQGLRVAVQKYQEELVRRYGRGSISLAQQNIVEQTGVTLQRTLENYRKSIVVREHIRQIIEPKINVTRRDIERWYNENIDKFQPQAVRSLRLILMDTQAEADAIKSRLDAGEEFALVADAENNMFSAAGGLLENAIGDTPFENPPVDSAIASLALGAHAGPIESGGNYWFVYIEKLDQPEQQSLMDVQLQIEGQLKAVQRRILTDRYYRSLMREVDLAELENMTDALVEIAVSRFAVIDDAGSMAPGS